MENTSSNPQDNTDTSNEPTLESLEKTMGPPPTDTNQPTEQPIEPVSPPNPELKPRKSKKKLVLTLLAVFVLIGAAAAYWFVLRPDDETATAPQQSTVESTEQQAPLKPATIAYSYEETVDGETEDCGPNRSSRLYNRPIMGGERVEASDALAGSIFTGSDASQNHVVAVTAASCGGGEEMIWYSSDAGKSYATVYTGEKATQEDGLPEQITSLKLASDNKSVVFGSLDGDTRKNTIKELDLASKAVKDIKTIDVAGVFLEGYDKSSQTLYYYTGCFQCDGVSRDKLLALNTSTAAESTLVDQTKDGTAGIDAVFNDDFSKLLTVRGTTSPDSMGAGAPYTVQEYHVQQKTTRTIATIAAGQYPFSVGYTADDPLPYYAEGKNVSTVGADGKATVVFEATNPIYGVYYVGKDYVVASAGTYENFTLVTYDNTAKKATTILTGDAQSTRIFGVGHQ